MQWVFILSQLDYMNANHLNYKICSVRCAVRSAGFLNSLLNDKLSLNQRHDKRTNTLLQNNSSFSHCWFRKFSVWNMQEGSGVLWAVFTSCWAPAKQVFLRRMCASFLQETHQKPCFDLWRCTGAGCSAAVVLSLLSHLFITHLLDFYSHRMQELRKCGSSREAVSLSSLAQTSEYFTLQIYGSLWGGQLGLISRL